MNKDIKLLFIAYYFPPYERVGGRRWSKFCKYLYKLNFDFDVVAGSFEGRSFWDKELIDYADRVIRVPLRAKSKPYFKKKLPKGLFQKIRWKFSYFIETILNSMRFGNFQDESINDYKLFLKIVEQQLKTNTYSHIIITGGPYRYLKLLLKIKGKEKIILDLRDPWLNDMITLSSRQIGQERQLEKSVIERADIITASETSVLKEYSENHTTFHLPHCIDLEDFQSSNAAIRNKIIYGGDYYGAIKELALIDKFNKEVNKDVSRVNFTFYSPMYNAVKSDFNDLDIEIKEAIDLDKFLSLAKSSWGNIYINIENRKNFFSTKFFELVACQRPILYFGPEGEVSNFILKNKLGFHIMEENLKEMSGLLIDNLVSKKIPAQYDLTKHTFDYESKRLANLIEELHVS